MQKILKFLIRCRVALAFLLLSSFIFFLKPFFNFITQTDNTLTVWFSKQDKAMQDLNEFYDNFGSDRFFLVGLEAGDVFSREAINLASQFQNKLEQNPLAIDVMGFPEMQDFYEVDDQLVVKKLSDSASPNHFLSYPYYQNRFFSSDRAKMFFYVDTGLGAAVNPQMLMEEADQFVKQNPLIKKGFYSGPILTDWALNEQVLGDQLLFLPLVFGGIVLLLLIITRRLFETCLISFLEAFLVVTTVGAYALLGYSSNVIVSIVIPLLVTVTIANSLHLVLQMHRSRAAGHAVPEALIDTVQEMAKPFFFTALTTVAGLLSFSPSSILPLKHMGYLSALGVLWALVINLFFLPALLSFSASFHKSPAVHHIMSGFLEKLARFLMGHARVVRVILIFISIVCVAGVLKIKIESNFLKYFAPDNIVRQDFEILDESMQGLIPVEVILESKNAIAKDPKLLKNLDLHLQKISQKTGAHILSVIPIIKKLYGVLDDAHQEIIPPTRENLAELYLLASSSGENFLSRFKNADDTQLRLELRLKWVSAEHVKQVVRDVEAILKPLLGQEIQLQVTGHGWLWVVLNNNILLSQVSSLILSLVIVSFLMMFFLKSIKLGLISLVPNLLPLLIGAAFMGFVHYPVDLVTVMIASLVMGVVVDDTIHYFTTYKHYLKDGLSQEDAIIKTHGSIGVSITYTAFILTCGFGILCFAEFGPTFRFGVLTALTLFISVLCEMIVGPVILKNLKS